MPTKQPLAINHTEDAMKIIFPLLGNPNYQRNRSETKQVEWYHCAGAEDYRTVSNALLAAGIPHTLDVTDWKREKESKWGKDHVRSSRLRTDLGELHDELSIHSLSIHVHHGVSVRHGNVRQSWTTHLRAA